jgi:lysophospholipase L1-like esterase
LHEYFWRHVVLKFVQRNVNLIFLATLLLIVRASLLEAVDPDRWEETIASFVEADRLNPPDDGVVLFTGSSSIRRWESLAEDMAPLPVLNRGFGGSEIADLVRYADRLITCHNPSAVVVFCGGNDINRGKEPETVAADFRQLAGIVRAELPGTSLFYISIRPPLKRWDARSAHVTANQLIEQYCMQTEGVKYINIWDQFLDPATGVPRPEFFVEDRVHMTRAGYQIWIVNIRPLLVSAVE